MTPQTQLIGGTSAEGLLEQGGGEETPPSQFVGGTSVEGTPQIHGLGVFGNRPTRIMGSLLDQGKPARQAPPQPTKTLPAQRQEPDQKTREGDSQTDARRTDEGASHPDSCP